MAKNRSLVVVVDAQAHEKLKDLNFRYFIQAKKQRVRNYTLETPLGNRRKVSGTLVARPNFKQHSAEYLYLEVNNTCNFSCPPCGVGNKINHIKLAQIINEDAHYITPEFVSTLASKIQNHPYAGLVRKMFYGGGEPLLSPKKFRTLMDGFEGIERTIHVVATNGCTLPLDYDKFAAFVEEIGRPYIFLSVSEHHKGQYARLSREAGEKLAQYIPQNVQPEHALEEKARIIGEHCENLGIGFTVNVLEYPDTHTEKDLREHIIKSDIEIISTELNGHRQPCSQGQELAIRSNGDIYPHCYDIFTGTNRIGVVGLLK
jgi:hypothetical protein